jgi:pimeloyl-ACP methyl ester carboxylesterase
VEWRLLTVEGPNGKLAVIESGNCGLPVVLVHGNGGSARVWDSQLRHLGHARRAIAPDLHGFGRSDPSHRGDYSARSFACDLEAVADQLELDRMVLVGHSIGGAVIAVCAARNRDRVAGLMFVDSVAGCAERSGRRVPTADTLGPGTYAFASKRWFERLLTGATERTRTRVLSMLSETDRAAFVGAAAAAQEVDVASLVADFDGPALHLYVPQFDSGPSSLHGRVSKLTHVPMTHTSHWPMMDRPGEFNRILDSFLDQVMAVESG